MGYEIREIPSSRWDKVQVYHIDVINRFQEKLAHDPHFMRKYRKSL